MKKRQENQRPNPKPPQQKRSRQKVQLIFEATIRLLEKGGLDALNTNAIAASAGVSIGTLYQFFPNKESILDGLAERELGSMSERVTLVMQDARFPSTQARITAIVRAVAESYGARRTAHRLVMEHSLTSGGSRLSSLLGKIMAHLSAERKVGAIRHAISKADAFVLAHAFAGVMRAMTREATDAPPLEETAEALTRLVTNFT